MTDSLLPQLVRLLDDQANQVRILVDRPDRVVACLTLPDGMRVVKMDTGVDAFEREASAMAMLAKVGVPVSEVLLVEPGPPSVLMATWAEGEPVTPASPAETLAEVGVILRRVHALPASGPWSSHPSIERWIEAWLQIVLPWWEEAGRASGEELRATWHWFEAIRPFLDDDHGRQMLFDGRPDHFLADAAGNLHLIDVADLQPGDPVMDLAVLELDAPGILPGVLAGYHPSPIERDRIEALVPFYVMLRALSGAEWQASIGGDQRVVERNLAVAHQSVTCWMEQRGFS